LPINLYVRSCPVKILSLHSVEPYKLVEKYGFLKTDGLLQLELSKIFHQSYVVSFLGAFVIGLLGNMYSRIFKGTAFTRSVMNQFRPCLLLA
jgi:hypothetical protein